MSVLVVVVAIQSSTLRCQSERALADSMNGDISPHF